MTVELWKKVLKRTCVASLLLAVCTLILQISCFGMVAYIGGDEGHSEMVEVDSVLRVDNMLEPILCLSAALLVCAAIELRRQHFGAETEKNCRMRKRTALAFFGVEAVEIAILLRKIILYGALVPEKNHEAMYFGGVQVSVAMIPLPVLCILVLLAAYTAWCGVHGTIEKRVEQ